MKIDHKGIIGALEVLRNSDDKIYTIFTQGSCFRLYMMLKKIYPTAKAYWSDMDGHCITKIDGRFYDIGGEVKREYLTDKNYYKVPKCQIKGFSILKHTKDGPREVKVEKYV